jgi:hypothetical protein
MKRAIFHSQLLAVCLQLAPLLQIARTIPQLSAAPALVLVRWIFGSVAMGSIHGLSGATGVTPSAVKSTNGIRTTVTFSITSPYHGTAKSYEAISGLPPGTTLSTRGTLSGVPTVSGEYAVRIRGWQTDGLGGNWAELIVPTTIIGTIPPQVTSQPQGFTLSEGLAANLSTTYTGHEPISLQWYKEDVEISGATNAVFSVPKIAQKDAGKYRLRLVNSVKTVFSDWAEINVQAAQVSRSISGKLEYYLSTQGGVNGVRLNIDEGGGYSVNSAADGSYAIELPASHAGEVTLTPNYATDVPVANGVTTADITLIRRHVLGLTPLDSPYKVLAGDVNGSDSVTTADITLIRRLILGVSTNFSAGLWRFVPSDEVFTNTTKPWTATRLRRYASIAAGTTSGQDFKAIKLGDVNGSWKAPTATTGSIIKSKAKGRLTVEKVTAAAGDVVGIPIKAEGFAAVTSMQFTMRWDPAQLEFVSAGNFELPGLTAGNFNSLKIQEGLLTFSWDPPSGQGVELMTISELFQVQMKVLAAGGATAEIAWSESPTPTEVTVDFSPVETDKVIGGVVVSGGTSVTPESLVLKILGISADGRLELSVQGPVGVQLAVETTSDLATWIEAQRIIGEGTSSPAKFTLQPDPNVQAKFWRVRVR